MGVWWGREIHMQLAGRQWSPQSDPGCILKVEPPVIFHFHALEKEMATHSSVLPGESQGRGSLVGCPLWGTHRVKHD